MRKICVLLGLFSLFSFSGFAQEDGEPKTCIDCHKSLVEQKVVHGVAADDCETCHMANDNEHPLEGVKGFELGDQMPALCYMCHEEPSKEYVHAAAEDCLGCHSPHGSPNKALLLESPESKLCSQCHDMEPMEMNFKHKPVAQGKCTDCHEAHQSDNSYLLVQDKSVLCINCHVSASMEKEKTNIHPPFDDDCANCHGVHSTEQDHLLLEKTPDLCYMCHDMQESIESAASIHKVVIEGKACTNCHSPHASNNNLYLPSEGTTLCFRCHDKKIKKEEGNDIRNIKNAMKEGNMIHGIIEGDGCMVCHPPHAAEYPGLLTAPHPEGAYAEAVPENFELCFMCHDAALIENETDSTNTNFRDGSRNMHWLHVNGQKGRSCTVCHNPHGSPNEHLIATKVWFGSWDMPVEFEITENGGSCATGCHARKEYQR